MISVDDQRYCQPHSLGVQHQRRLFCMLVQVCVWILCWVNLNAVTCVAACSLTQGDHLLRLWQNADVSTALAVSKCCLRLCRANSPPPIKWLKHQWDHDEGPELSIRTVILYLTTPPRLPASLCGVSRLVSASLAALCHISLAVSYGVPLHLSRTVAFWESWPVFDPPLSKSLPPPRRAAAETSQRRIRLNPELDWRVRCNRMQNSPSPSLFSLIYLITFKNSPHEAAGPEGRWGFIHSHTYSFIKLSQKG